MRRSTMLGTMAALAARPMTAGAQALTPITVGSAHGWTLAEGYIAAAKGFFAAAGLDPRIENAPNGGAMTAALLGGSLDVTCTNIGSIADAYAHGLPIALFAPSTLAIAGQSNTTLAVLRDSPIRTAHDLIGKTIALSTLRDLQHAALLEWLEKNGGDIRATNYVEVGPANMLEALKLGRIDAAVMSEVYSAVGRNDTHVLGRPYEALGRTLMVAGWAARRDWLAANPLVARKFLGAMEATARWAAGHQADMLPVMHDVTGTDLDTLRQMGRLFLGDKIDVSEIQPTIDASAKYGFLPRAFPAGAMIVNVT
ncbi:MAG: ABC transporter substrate-binding protein [Candidatus Lustribacter sp.]